MTKLLIRLFIKNYRNTGSFQVRERYGKFAGIVGIATNLLLFIIKIIAGTLFNSIAITADAVNNLSDSGSSIITLVGFKISGKPADSNHPYGHARMEYISGLLVSVVIMFLGLQLMKSSYDKIINPQITQFSFISVLVLLVSILLKIWQSAFYKSVSKIIDSVTLLATSADSRNDILATSVVLVGMLITRFTGVDLDGYMGIAVAIFILISGVRLVMATISPLLGTAPTKELVDCIYEKILSYENIIGLHDLTVHSYGASRCFASVHCEVPAEQDIMLSHDIIDNIERDFLSEMDIHLVIHLDPVVTNDARTNEVKSEVENRIGRISSEINMHDFRAVWGVSHTNLIFDVVVPYDFKWSDDVLIKLITDEISRMNPSYNAVVIVDHQYVPGE